MPPKKKPAVKKPAKPPAKKPERMCLLYGFKHPLCAPLLPDTVWFTISIEGRSAVYDGFRACTPRALGQAGGRGDAPVDEAFPERFIDRAKRAVAAEYKTDKGPRTPWTIAVVYFAP